MIGPPVALAEATVDHHSAAGVVRALAPTTLHVDGGRSLAIMGPSGCGKSTLLSLLAGLATPTSGSVTIGDRSVSAMTERERVSLRRQLIGVVYQADNLLPHLTIEENVALQRSICGQQPAPAMTARLLDQLGIAGLAHRRPDQLSGGQRQRAGIARAVAHQPAVILADEPTAALDADSGATALDLLTSLQRDLGATLVVVTHDRSIAEQLDRIVALQPALTTASPE